MSNKRIFPSELLSLRPSDVTTREEVLNTVDRQAVEIGAQNARIYQIIHGGRPTGDKDLDAFMSVADAIMGTVLDATGGSGRVAAFDAIGEGFAHGAEATTRRPLDRTRWLKRINRSLERMGEHPITPEEIERLDKKTQEGYVAQLKGDITYLDEIYTPRKSKPVNEEGDPDLHAGNETVNQPPLLRKGTIPVPRSKRIGFPQQKPVSESSFSDAPIPRSKPVENTPKRKPEGNASLRRSDAHYGFNPFNLSNPNLKLQAETIERNPVMAKRMILAEKRDPKLFGLA